MVLAVILHLMKSSFACLLMVVFWLEISAQQRTPLLEFSLVSGYQVASLQWSVAGNLSGQSPNVLSEVKWQKLAGPVVSGGLNLRLFQRVYLLGELYSATVKRGLATDSDYGQDDRGGRTYYAKLNADEGFFRGGSLKIGYHLVDWRRLTIGLSAGYRQSQQELYLLDHPNEVPGERNLRSVYHTRWHGAAAAANFRYRLLSHLTLSDEIIYGQSHYRATADWNLIDAFQHPVSFRQRARGFELQNALSCTYQFKPSYALLLTAMVARSETGSGIDDLYLESGTVQSTRLNGVSKQVKSIQLGLLFHL
jgi:hypothetical protein